MGALHRKRPRGGRNIGRNIPQFEGEDSWLVPGSRRDPGLRRNPLILRQGLLATGCPNPPWESRLAPPLTWRISRCGGLEILCREVSAILATDLIRRGGG